MFYVHGYFACEYVCIMYVPDTLGKQKKVFDLLVELQKVMCVAVLWISMGPIDPYVWLFGPHLVELFGKD